MIRRMVAILALLLLMGLGVFGGCQDKLVEEVDEFVELRTWFFTSGIPNNEIIMKHAEKDAKFEINVDVGEFWVMDLQKYVQSATVNNGDTVTWYTRQGINEFDRAYVETIATVGDNIVGYAVIKITRNYVYTADFDAEIIKSVTFPKVGGTYQHVTRKQVENKINEAKK